jgi:hypothetical protein
MDENSVREHAEAHAQAVVQGDLGKAAADLTDEVKQSAPEVMKQLPRPATSASIEAVTAEGDEFVAHIKYSGENASATVASRWAEQSGRPMITRLDIV